MTTTRRPSEPVRKQLNLALQGGGAQGAFTWGVLDRLLDEPDIEIGRISGASAGALNGAALATGLARGGRDGAKEHLARLWNQVAQVGSLMTLMMMPLRKPGLGVWDDAMPLLSPYQTNPVGMSPLRAVLDTVVDESLLRGSSSAPQLYVNAVHVHTGSTRVFGPADISIDAILASGCAPLTFPAVQIDSESYWDGTYGANPCLWPLYEENLNSDILMVELTPLHRTETPVSPKNIVNRINEIASLNGLVAEMRALDLVNRHAAQADIRMHVLSIAEQPGGLLGTEPSIRRTVGRVLFELLRQEGRRACDAWLAQHGAHVGKRSTVDIEARYLAPHAQLGRAMAL